MGEKRGRNHERTPGGNAARLGAALHPPDAQASREQDATGRSSERPRPPQTALVAEAAAQTSTGPGGRRQKNNMIEDRARQHHSDLRAGTQWLKPL